MILFDNLWLWLDQHFVFYFCLVGGLITLALFLAVVPLFHEQAEIERTHDWRWGLLTIAILAAGRWPSIFFASEVNPDESQMLAGAHALIYDPVFWRSVDGGTAGPLDFFALWPAGWIFGWQSYLTARITALALLAVSLIFAHQCMSLILGRKIARVAGLAVVCFEALTNSGELLHYSTELLPVALLTVAVYAAIRRWFFQGDLFWNGLGGLLIGAVPLAKLQAVPLAILMGLGWLIAEILLKSPITTRRIAYLLVGAVLPMSAFAGQLTISGEWENFIVPYVLSNFQYVDSVKMAFSQLFLHQWGAYILEDSLVEFLLPMILCWMLLMLRMRRIVNQTTRFFTYFSFAVFLTALFCIIYPGHLYIHYWQMMIVPATFLLGAQIGNLLNPSSRSGQQRDRWIVALCASVLVATLLVHRAMTPNSFMGYRTYLQKRPHSELVQRILSRARPGDSIAIWGWAPYIYVETGLRQATREAIFYHMIMPGAYRQFHCARFIADLLNSKSAFFLDSTGVNNSVWGNPGLAHDHQFPGLAELIKSNYTLIDEVSGSRLYRRREAPSQ